MSTKLFKTRGGATEFLRKQGVDKINYKHYIVETPEGFETGVPDKKLKKTSPFKTTIKKITTPKRKVAKKVGRDTVSGVARGLIKAGKSNAEIWKVIQKQFKLSDTKRNYPAWYRSEAKRKG